MDERQKIVTKIFTRDELEGMTLGDVATLVGEAGPGAIFRGKAIVTRPDGSIKYDPDAKPGDFGETPEELARATDEDKIVTPVEKQVT